MTSNEQLPRAQGAAGTLVPTPAVVARGLVRSFRIRQWTKNGLLYVGLVFSFNLGNPRLVLLATLGAAVYCALSSATYLINDLADVEKDRLHPRKRHRAIASGIVSPAVAAAAAGLLIAIALPTAFWINTAFGLIALGYLALTVAYSYFLKHFVIIDVIVLAAGFVIRAVAGAVAVGVPISPWLYVCTVLGALFLGIGKRRHELVLLRDGANGHRPALEQYSEQLLDQMMAVVTPALVMAYSLYTFSAPNLPENHAMMLTIPFVLYGVFRYLYLIHVRGEGGSPEEILLRDRAIMVDIVAWFATSTVILYFVR